MVNFHTLYVHSAEFREASKHLGKIANKVRENDRNVNNNVVSCSLYINGQESVKKVFRPTVGQVSLMDKAH